MRVLTEVWLRKMDVQTLALIDERPSRHSKIDDLLLGDLPNSFVEILNSLRDFCNILNRASKCDKLVLDGRGPQVLLKMNQITNKNSEYQFDKIFDQMAVDTDKLA